MEQDTREHFIVAERTRYIEEIYTNAHVSIQEVKYIGTICELPTFQPKYRVSIYQLLLGYPGEMYQTRTKPHRTTPWEFWIVEKEKLHVADMRHNGTCIHLRNYKCVHNVYVRKSLRIKLNKRFNDLLY